MPVLLLCDFVLTNYSCDDPISKEGPTLRSWWVALQRMDWRGRRSVLRGGSAGIPCPCCHFHLIPTRWGRSSHAPPSRLSALQNDL